MFDDPPATAQMTSAVRHEACANPAVDAFDSIVYSRDHTFKACPRPDHICQATRSFFVPVREKWEPPMFFFGAWSPQDIFLQRLYDVHGMGKRPGYSTAR
jgi:hypothetical protein